ncbi:hypothetical protein LAZ67_X001549 [Cordylochernes scorpioides]|uniref:Uncharacterized protein n=1 Tax=Cordylochernes scorpioides TaxID=51811 RepID=A0ABY6LT01_9ARAC|nr:hypothetical protein LAZ67_X001549 [Cordylochernes scorpioides]
MKSLRCPRASLSQQSQCPLSWVCKAAALGPCQFSIRLRPLLGMRIYRLSCPMKNLRCPYASLSQKSQCPLYWVCKAAALGPCQFSARLWSLLGMRMLVGASSTPGQLLHVL